MESQRGSDAVEAYWRSVVDAHNEADGPKQARAGELLRLKEVAEGYRNTLITELPAITISTAELGGRISGKVDPLGSWGQGVSIQLKVSRVDPFDTTAADMGLPPTKGDRSLLFGAPLLHTAEGERLRRIEADLLVLQQCLRALQYLTVERELLGWGEAKTDLGSWGGNGSWFATKANEVWEKWCAAEGVPFVPVRHGRVGREEASPTIIEREYEDQPFTVLRPSCAGWPMAALAIPRELPQERPESLTIRESEYPISEQLWLRWRQEQASQLAVFLRFADVGEGGLLRAVEWPEGRQPVIDEINGEQLVTLPPPAAAIAMSSRVVLNFDAAEALQAVEATLAGVDRERGTNLWPTFLQLACNHPAAPGASRVQSELEIDLDAPAPIKAGEQPVIRTGLPGDGWDKPVSQIEALVPWIYRWKVYQAGSTCYGGPESKTVVSSKGVHSTCANTEDLITVHLHRDDEHRIDEICLGQVGTHDQLAVRRAGDCWEIVYQELADHQDLLKRLLQRLDPGAAIIAPEPEPTPIEAGEPSQSPLRKQRKARAKAADELTEVIEHACRKHGRDWPRGLAAEMVKRYGISKQSISGRKQACLAQLEQEVAA